MIAAGTFWSECFCFIAVVLFLHKSLNGARSLGAQYKITTRGGWKSGTRCSSRDRETPNFLKVLNTEDSASRHWKRLFTAYREMESIAELDLYAVPIATGRAG